MTMRQGDIDVLYSTVRFRLSNILKLSVRSLLVFGLFLIKHQQVINLSFIVKV